jgi:hypothetical protein
LIDAPRQSDLAKPASRDNHPCTRPPLLILIDAPFSSRLSRYSRRASAGVDKVMVLDAHARGVR